MLEGEENHNLLLDPAWPKRGGGVNCRQRSYNTLAISWVLGAQHKNTITSGYFTTSV